MWGGETRSDCFTSFFPSPRTKYLMKFNTFSASYGCIRILEYFKTWTSLHLLWSCSSPSIACFLQEQDILRKCNVIIMFRQSISCEWLILPFLQPWCASSRRSHFSYRNWLSYQFRSRRVINIMFLCIHHLNLAENARRRKKHKRFKRFKH